MVNWSLGLVFFGEKLKKLENLKFQPGYFKLYVSNCEKHSWKSR